MPHYTTHPLNDGRVLLMRDDERTCDEHIFDTFAEAHAYRLVLEARDRAAARNLAKWRPAPSS
jgi:hypothetical protein